MGPFFSKKGVQNSVSRTSKSVTKPDLLPAASKSAPGRRSRQSPLKGGSGGDNSGMSRISIQNFLRSQEERKTQADNRPLCAQPFGLSTSPFVLTRLMIVIATFLRRRAITLHPYLDDWLARNQNRRRLLEHRQFILSLINSLGLIINYEK